MSLTTVVVLVISDLKRAVHDSVGTASGLDGWRADEIMLFSDSMFQTLAEFHERCETVGQVPTSCKTSRQVHLSKGKPPQADGATLAKDLRTVSIASMYWRVYTKAKFQHVATQNWLRQAMPECVDGGVPGRGVGDGIGQLLRCVHKDWYVGTLDLSLAFDMVDPSLAIRIMRRCGLEPLLAELLLQVWTDQRRFLQYLGETKPGSEHVTVSLPPGDSFSMCAMSFFTLPVINAIKSAYPNATQVVFADDRSFSTASARELQQVKRMWREWALKLGLKENDEKAQFYHPKVRGRKSLVAEGFDPERVGPNIKILGYCFSAALGRKAENCEKARLEESQRRVAKCWCLPGTLKRKVRLAQGSALPKAAWGWLFRRPALEDLTAFESVVRRLMKKQKVASPHLFQLVKGHRWDLRFVALHEAVNVVHRLVSKTGAEIGAFKKPKSGWVGAVRKGLRELGWIEQLAPWTWKHDALGCTLCLRRGQEGWQPEIGKVQHMLRESWRRTCYMRWQAQDRIDSRMCRNVPYGEARHKELRYLDLTAHQLAVVRGAAVSPQKFNQMKKNSALGCPYCKCSVADWQHVAWDCAMAPRPRQVSADACFDVLQKRLGWPSGLMNRRELDTGILAWLAKVREGCLVSRRQASA